MRRDTVPAQPGAGAVDSRCGNGGSASLVRIAECDGITPQTVRYAEDLAELYTVERAQREALLAVNERLRAVIDSMADGMLTVDGAGLVVSANAAVCAMLDRPREEVEGAPLGDLLGGAGALAVLPARQAEQACTGGSPASGQAATCAEAARVVELEMPAPQGGGRLALRVSTSPLRDGGRVLVLHDISMQRRVQRLKQDFLAIISHEMRTPLNGILGLGDVLLEEARRRGDDDAVELLEHLLQAARRMHAMVREVVRFAEVQGGRVEASDAPVDVRTVLSIVLNELEGIASAHGVVLGPAPGGVVPVMVRGNSLLLRELFLHVVHNAIRFNRRGGMVTVRCRLQGDNVPGRDAARDAAPDGGPNAGPVAGTNATASAGPRAVLVEVADTGIGIGAQERERVFESFYQAQDHMTRSREGLGIGLTLARAIARLHGGEVTLTSEVGRGTTVTIRLEAHDAATAA